jgi:aquaporin Z
MSILKRSTAEFIGTYWLVFGGCGAALYAAAFPTLGIGFAGVALAFGLTVLTGAFALGHISGAHFNPAISIGLVAGKRFPAKDLLPYIAAQVLGAIAAAYTLLLIMMHKANFAIGTFASNGYGQRSPGGFGGVAALVAETVLTLFFVLIIMGATDTRAPKGFAPIAIGLALTLIHLISIPIDNTSVNPARSTGPALIAGGAALHQLWLFWAAPIAGGILGGLLYRTLFQSTEDSETATEINLEIDITGTSLQPATE